MRKDKNKIKVKITLDKKHYNKLKSHNKGEIDSIINNALDMYFNKDFCAKELERNIILGMWVLD